MRNEGVASMHANVLIDMLVISLDVAMLLQRLPTS